MAPFLCAVRTEMKLDTKGKTVAGGMSVAVLFGLITGGWEVYGIIEDHVQEKEDVLDRIDALEQADAYNRLADVEMWLCDVDPSTKWWRGDCTKNGDSE